jgi:hypothetical protein
MSSSSLHQSASSHTRLDPIYHFVLAPIALIVSGSVFYQVFLSLSSGRPAWANVIPLALFGVWILIGTSLIRMYSLKVQDRVIRMELNFRYYLLTQKALPTELSIRQCVALRFASNPELVDLVDETLKHNLNSTDIKSRIKNWRADNDRV